MQTISPENFKVTEKEIRQRFGLDSDDCVIDYGYENEFNDYQKHMIQKNYDNVSLYIRTRPDFMITKNGETCFVEAKQRTNTVEAVQLFFNQQTSMIGVPVMYSFPEFNIPAQFIQIENILVPPRYRESFDRFFKEEIRSSVHSVEFTYISTTKGSGDPFIQLDEQSLQDLARAME